MRFSRRPIAVLGVAIPAAFACSSRAFQDGGDAGATADSGSVAFGDAAAGSGLACSSDMHQVLNPDGSVVTTCPADQGCAAGVCMPACKAAGDNRGNVGCDFLVATPSFFADYSLANGSYEGPCYAIFLANNWTTPMHVTVTRGGASYPISQFARIPVVGQPESSWLPVPASGIPQGQVAVLFMDASPTSAFQCPVSPAMMQSSAVEGTGKGTAWHIVTDAPVSAYDILPYGGASSYLPSAELLLPTSAWGTNYVAVVPTFSSGSDATGAGPQWGQIVAMQDNTQVSIVPTVTLPSGPGVAGAPAHAVTTYTLQAGEVVQWQNPYDPVTLVAAPMEMSGTILSSNNPIAFMGGNGYLCLGSHTSEGGGCDSGHQQIAPVSALASEYAPAPYATRRADLVEESIPYRIVGMSNGTTITIDPPVAGAPATLALGQWVDFEATGPFVIKSQDDAHPFYIGQMMSGCKVNGGSRAPGGCLGDEEFVNVMPPAQFLASYVFFTDLTYPTTTLTFVRVKTSAGFEDVTLDCLPQPVTGWHAMGSSSGSYEWATVDLIRGGVGNGTCQNGPHSAKSKGRFGLTVWGVGDFASYGYPAGTNATRINDVVIPPVPN